MIPITSPTDDVRDVLIAEEVVFVATAGGLWAADATGHPLGPIEGLPTRDVRRVAVIDGDLVVETARGAFRWTDGRWSAAAALPALPGALVVDRFDGGGVRREAGLSEARIIGPTTTRTLAIAATAAADGAWGTAEGVVVDDDGQRLGAVPAPITALARSGDGWIVGTRGAGWWWLGDDTARRDEGGACGSFVTSITRWRGALVVGSFDGGACVQTASGWAPVDLPSPMVDDVLAVGDTLWVAGAAGLTRVGAAPQTWGEVGPNAAPGAPGLNHPAATGLAVGPDGRVWVSDVLGPTSITRTGAWKRYRWQVWGHSHQAVAACDDGAVWVATEDDGVAVLGAAVGARQGRTPWRAVRVTEGLPEDWVMAIACAAPGAAWVGTYAHGVGQVDAGGFHPLAGTEALAVQALATDGPRLWIGAHDGLYVAEAGQTRRVSSEDTWALRVDAQGVWVGTQAGLYQIADPTRW